MFKKISYLTSFVLFMALVSSASASLVNYYDFEDGSGYTVTDVVGGQNGIITDPCGPEWTSGATLGPTPQWGYRTNNISGGTPGSLTAIDYITCPNSVAASDAVTIAMWIMVPDVNLPEGNPKTWYMRPVWKQDDTGTKGLSWGIRPNTPKGNFRVYVGSIATNVSATAEGVFEYGVWQHLATTFDVATGTLKLYVNGLPAASLGGITNTMNTTSVGFRLGGPISPPGGIANQPFNGFYDEVRIFNTALSDSEILALYQLTSTPACWNCPGQPSGDTNGDGNINATDYFNFKKAYGTASATHPHGTGVGQYNCCCDFNKDTKVNATDYFTFKKNYGKTGLGTCADKSCP